VDLKLVRSG